MNKIILLTDYRNSFYSLMGSQENGFDLLKLKEYFEQEGFYLDIKQFCDVDFNDKTLKGTPVLYTSLEDPGLFYKSFIEDVILGLEMAEAWLIPRYYYLHAHHNKVFQEIFRQTSGLEALKNLNGHFFGVPSECEERTTNLEYPVVIKPAAGAMSTGVTLVKSVLELKEAIYKISKTERPLMEELRNIIRPFARRIIKLFNPRIRFASIVPYREKFVIQQFVEGLKNDYKILIYSDKYYVLRRENRKNDFRASGSGLLSYPRSLPDGMLDFAKKIFEYFDVPYISLDVAYDGNSFYLIEFQFLMFGTYTLEKSKYYFIKIDDEWRKIEGISEIEKVFVQSVCHYVKNKGYLEI